MTDTFGPPGDAEFELALFGPGYGESVLMHIGHGQWVIVDSCTGVDGQPEALRYLDGIGVDPARSVALIVATHWHDDHIRGIARMVERCPNAQFCCAGVLCEEEFLAVLEAVEGRHLSASGSGLRELHRVFSLLGEARMTPRHALSSRVLMRRESCTITSLSPGDEVYQKFLTSIGGLIPKETERKTRIASLSPNEVAVALWVDAREFSVLLGADLEKRGWVTILNDGATVTEGKASVFKIPHHGSKNAHEPGVWDQMVKPDPIAVLTPWRRGRHALPTRRDAKRILALAPNAYSSGASIRKSRKRPSSRADRAVSKTLRDSSILLHSLDSRTSSVRLRRMLASGSAWSLTLTGGACHLADFAA